MLEYGFQSEWGVGALAGFGGLVGAGIGIRRQLTRAAYVRRRPAPRAAGRRRVAAAPERTIGAMPIYLDHAATTPLRREALEAMLPYLTEHFGNASSPHAFGRAAHAGLDEARERVALAIGAQAREIVFTSGGSEANNLAVKGAAWAGKARGHRIVTTAVEHHSVGHTMRYLEKFGFEIVELPVDRYGRVDPEEIEAAITPRTILVSVMLANNEVGTIQPIAEIAACVRRHRGVLLHTDAVQAAAHLAHRRGGAGRRPALSGGAQVRGAQGRRRPVRPPWHEHPGPAAGRGSGTLSPRRDRGRCRGRRDGRRARAGHRGAAGHGAADRRAA